MCPQKEASAGTLHRSALIQYPMAANRHALHATPEGAELLRPDERNILLAIGLVEQFLQQKHQVILAKAWNRHVRIVTRVSAGTSARKVGGA